MGKYKSPGKFAKDIEATRQQIDAEIKENLVLHQKKIEEIKEVPKTPEPAKQTDTPKPVERPTMSIIAMEGMTILGKQAGGPRTDNEAQT